MIIAIRADLLKFKIANWSEDKTYVLNGVNIAYFSSSDWDDWNRKPTPINR